jgi:hypothetical protein
MGSCSAVAFSESDLRMSSRQVSQLGALAIHLVDEDGARHAEVVALLPDLLGARPARPSGHETTTMAGVAGDLHGDAASRVEKF